MSALALSSTTSVVGAMILLFTILTVACPVESANHQQPFLTQGMMTSFESEHFHSSSFSPSFSSLMIPISHDEKSLNNPEPRISSKELLSNINNNNLQNGGVFRYYDSIFQDASCTLPLKIKHLVNETSGVCTSPSNNLCQPIAGAGYSKGYKCLVFSAPPTVEPGYLALVFHPNKDCSGIASNTGMSIIPSGVSQISYFPMFECSRGFSANTSVMGNTHLFIM